MGMGFSFTYVSQYAMPRYRTNGSGGAVVIASRYKGAVGK